MFNQNAIVYRRTKSTVYGFFHQAFWNGAGRKQLTLKHGNLWGKYDPLRMFKQKMTISGRSLGSSWLLWVISGSNCSRTGVNTELGRRTPLPQRKKRRWRLRDTPIRRANALDRTELAKIWVDFDVEHTYNDGPSMIIRVKMARYQWTWLPILPGQVELVIEQMLYLERPAVVFVRQGVGATTVNRHQ